MASLNFSYLAELDKYVRSGAFAEDFSFSPEERRLEMIDFLEKLMELGEAADEAATGIIMKNIKG